VTDVSITEGMGLPKKSLNDTKKIRHTRNDEKSIVISESSLLVPLGKSKKLTAIRKQSQALQTIEKNPAQSDEISSSGLNEEVIGLLKEAQEQIDAKIKEIMASYPPGKKNRMFALRFGSPESIKQMNMKAIFTRLDIVKPKKFAPIEGLDYFGHPAPSKKSGAR
jgi:hypothetical protein